MDTTQLVLFKTNRNAAHKGKISDNKHQSNYKKQQPNINKSTEAQSKSEEMDDDQWEDENPICQIGPEDKNTCMKD